MRTRLGGVQGNPGKLARKGTAVIQADGDEAKLRRAESCQEERQQALVPRCLRQRKGGGRASPQLRGPGNAAWKWV